MGSGGEEASGFPSLPHMGSPTFPVGIKHCPCSNRVGEPFL